MFLLSTTSVKISEKTIWKSVKLSKKFGKICSLSVSNFSADKVIRTIVLYTANSFTGNVYFFIATNVFQILCFVVALHKKWSFWLRISSVNATESAVSSGFGLVDWRNPYWKTSFFVQYCLFRSNIWWYVRGRVASHN